MSDKRDPLLSSATLEGGQSDPFGVAATAEGEEDFSTAPLPPQTGNGSGIKALFKGAPRDLWAVVAVVLLESMAYFTMSFLFILMLETEYDMGDVEASTAYALFGVAISVYGILFGWVVDRLRVRRSLILYSALGVVSKLVLGLVPSPVTLWLVMLGPLSFAISIGGTAVLAGVRRYTTRGTRNTAFAIRYIAMNVGALLAQPTSDGVRIGLVPLLPMGYSRFLAMTAVLHVAALLLSVCLVRDVQVADEEDNALSSGRWEVTAMQPDPPRERLSCRRLRSKFTPNLGRFIILSISTLGAKSVFRYLDSLYPLWMSRAAFPVANPTQVPFNTFLIINPVIVIAFTAFLATFMERRRWHPYWIILVGTAVSGLAPFWMMITEYAAVIVFITQLSIGEITYSPMLSTYSCWFAPAGEEGTFFALATIPLFAAKAGAGYMSGQVLQNFCPAAASNATATTLIAAQPVACSPVVWLIVGCVACSSPLLILLFMRCLKIPDPRDTAPISLDDVTFSDIDVSDEDEVAISTK